MGFPATCPFTGADNTVIQGNTTDFFGGTGGLTWVGDSGYVINNNHTFVASGSPHILLTDGTTSDIVMSAVVVAINSLAILILRSNSGFTQYLAAWVGWPNSSSITLYDESVTQIAQVTGLTLSNGDTFGISGNGTAIVVTQNGTTRISTTSSHGQTNKYHGLYNGQFDDFAIDTFAIAVPTATVSSPLNTGNIFTGTSGTGGTGPYTYQWQRSTVPNSGFTNLSNGSGISGATTLTMTDGSAAALAATTAQTALYYQIVVTDSLSATFTSNIVCAALGKRPIRSLWIWDSIGAGNGTVGPGPNYLLDAPAIYGPRVVTLTNLSDGGQSTSHWYDSQGSGVQAQLIADSTAGISAGQTMCEIRLGINDASGGRTAMVYAANLAGMAAYLLGQGYTLVVIHYPTGIQSASIMALMLTYLSAIDALDNGTTIKVGDKASFYYFSMFSIDLLSDGTHQNDAGLIPLADLTVIGTVGAIGDIPLTPVANLIMKTNIGTY